MRIFLDTHLLFSATKSDGAIRKYLEVLLYYGHILVADPYVLEEVQRNTQKNTHGA